MRRLRAYSAILYILLWISFAVVVESQYRDVQPTCLDHFFVGQRKSGIRKLGSANRLSNEDANAVLCEMPPSLDPESVVTTTIHSGLENPHGHKMIEQSTVRYQISSLELLRNITKSADSCTQTIKIMLPASYSTNTQPASFESVYGVKSAIQRNGTIELIGKDAGVLHLFPAQNDNHTDSLQPHIRAGPLVCQQKVAIDKDCLFHMADQSTLTLSELQQAGRISFAFRTDQPNTPLLTLKADDNSAIQIDIVQGYLIKIKYSRQSNEEVHQLKLLSDGFWHTVDINLLTSSLFIDQLETSIMLDSTRVAQPKNVDFAQFRGQIARIKYNSDEGFKCMQSAGVSSTNTNVPVEICKKNSRNFCNCYAPAAAVGNACDNVESLNKEQMFQMRRNPTKSALFYIDDYDQGQALSALFKSDGDSGLVFNTVTGEEPHLRHTQVFYVGRNMTAIVCESRPAEKLDANCITCSIDIYEGFSSYSWHRVSYFKTKGYDYLTVNEQICQLRMAPIENSHHIYTKNSHKISKHNALFVGGYPNTGTRDKALATPLDDYVDNTREKVPSIQGCIGDLFIGGQRRSLVQAYDRMRKISAGSGFPSGGDIFSIDKGCAHCERNFCNGAQSGPSYLSTTKANCACDCATALLHTSVTTAGESSCKAIDGTTSRQQSIALSASQRGSFEIPIAPSDHSESCSSTGCYLDKLWVVFRPPTGNDNVEKILRFEDIKSSENRSIEIGTSNKGTKVHISTNGLTYDFLLDISDGRSHFVIISRNAAVGTRKHYYSTRIQVDNHHFDIPYIYMSSIDKIEVTQLHESSAKFNNGGCLSDIGISYKRDSDDDSKRHRLEGKIVNIIEQILQNANASNQLRFTNECGLRDNNIWMSPIAPAGFGYLRPYNPRGVGEPVGRLPDGGNKLAWRIILLIILIVLLAIFVFVIAICILVKQRKKRDYDTKRGRTYRKAAELKPLRSLKAVDKDEKVKPIGEISSPYSKPWVPQPHPDRRDPIKRQSSNLEEGFGLSQVDIMQSAEIVRRDSIRLPPLTRLDEVPHIDV